MKVMVIPIVIGAFGTATKGLLKGLKDLLRRVMETCCHSDSSERPSANAGMKNSQGVKMIKRETESLLIVAQNNAIRTNYVKTKIDKTQQNSKYRLWDDKTINHIISECSKLAQKEYKIKHGWVEKLIYWELNLTIQTNKSVLEIKIHKLLWDFEIQMNHQILVRGPYLVIINKKKRIVNFAIPADHRTRKLKKLWNMKVTEIPIITGAFCTVTKGFVKGLEDLEIRGRVEIIQTTALFRLARILRRVLET